jgi:hypothetical protein
MSSTAEFTVQRSARFRSSTLISFGASALWTLFALTYRDPSYDVWAVLASGSILLGLFQCYVWPAPPGREGVRLLGIFTLGTTFLSSGLSVVTPTESSVGLLRPSVEAYSFAVESSVCFCYLFLVGAWLSAPRRGPPSAVGSSEAGPTPLVATALAATLALVQLGFTFTRASLRTGTLPLILFNVSLIVPLLVASRVATSRRSLLPLAIVFGALGISTLYTSSLGIFTYPATTLILAYLYLRKPLPWGILLLTGAAVVLLNPAKHVFRSNMVDRDMMTTDISFNQATDWWEEGLEASWDGRQAPRDNSSRLSAVQRLNYNGITAYIYTLVPHRIPYEMGGTFADVPIVLVPRVLYPNKPLSAGETRGRWLIKLGLQTEESVERTAVAVPTAAEAYWNFGWPGVVFLPMVWGIIVGALLRLAPRDLVARTAFVVVLATSLGSFLDMFVWIIPQLVVTAASAPLARFFVAVGAPRQKSTQRTLTRSTSIRRQGR